MKLFLAIERTGGKIALLLIVLLFSLCFTPPLWALPLKTTAPNFTLLNLEGKRISLRDFQGQTVILKLGTTWCPGCRDQDKELQQLDLFLREAGIPLIEVFLDDPAEEVRAYQRQQTMKSPVVTLLGNGDLLRDYSIYAIPRLIILSPEQKVLSDSNGMTASQIKAQILQNSKKSLKQ